jgi:hypothetical protein
MPGPFAPPVNDEKWRAFIMVRGAHPILNTLNFELFKAGIVGRALPAAGIS